MSGIRARGARIKRKLEPRSEKIRKTIKRYEKSNLSPSTAKTNEANRNDNNAIKKLKYFTDFKYFTKFPNAIL